MKYALAALYLAVGPGLTYLAWPPENHYLWGLFDGAMIFTAVWTLIGAPK